MSRRQITVSEIASGDVLANPVADRAGNILLPAGSVLTERHRVALRRHGIEQVEIREAEILPEEEPPAPDWRPFAASEPVPEARVERLEREIDRKLDAAPVPPKRSVAPSRTIAEVTEMRRSWYLAKQLRLQAAETCVQVFAEIASRGSLRPDKMREFIGFFVNKGINHPFVLPAMVNLRNYDDYLVDQAIKSTVYSLMIGAALGFDRKELAELCECALLHDIGMIRVPSALWWKKGDLAIHERLEIQKHVIYGADMLAKIPQLSYWAEVVAYQHHERFDGSGYPKEKRGNRIGEYARIVGLADHYAARTAPRPYREKHHGYNAMSEVLTEQNRLFDPVIVRAFLGVMGLYPVGSRVQLSDRRTGMVVAARPGLPYRSVVLADPFENPAAGLFTEAEFVDLAIRSDLVILKAA